MLVSPKYLKRGMNMRKNYMKLLGLAMITLLAATSVSAVEELPLAISVGDTFDFTFTALNTVEINGTDYSNPDLDVTDDVNVEVIEIKSDNKTVSVKETYGDDSTDLVDSEVDTWEGYYLFAFIYLYIAFAAINPELAMDFSEPEYANVTEDPSTDEDYTVGYFATSDPNAYEDFDDDVTDEDIVIVVDAAKGEFSYSYANVTTIDGELADTTAWAFELDFTMEFVIEYERSLVTKVLIDYTLTETLGSAEKITHFLLSWEESGGLLGGLDLPGPSFIIALFSIFVVSVVVRRKK